MGYTSYLSASHTRHKIVYCDFTSHEHLVVCEADHSVSSAVESNQLDCTTNDRIMRVVLEQKDLYQNGMLGSRSSDRPSFESRWHDTHWDYSMEVRI